MSIIGSESIVTRVRSSITPAGILAGAFVAALSAAIVAWQIGLSKTDFETHSHHTITAATGLDAESKDYAYFLYYLNYYPIATRYRPLQYTKQEAQRIFDDFGPLHYMTRRRLKDFGDPEPGKTYLYLPYATVRGSPEHLSVIPLHTVLFIGALLALFLFAWWAGIGLAGTTLVALFGSNSFQLYEVYGRENLFGWTISTAIVLLALHLPLLVPSGKVGRRYLFALAAFSGALLATIRVIRAEPGILLISVVLSYLLGTVGSRRDRVAAVVLSGLSFIAVGFFWHSYFLAKADEARTALQRVGGEASRTTPFVFHPVIHPLFCGLGDFDRTHGYAWNDHAAYGYALQRLRAAPFSEDVTIRNGCYSWPALQEASTAESGPLCASLELHPLYTTILRDKIISDIIDQPGWYGDILWQRLKRIASETTPVRFALSPETSLFQLSFHYILAGVFLLACFIRRAWWELKLLLFMLPLSFPALLIYSGGGNTWYSCFHLVVSGLLLTAAMKGLCSLVRSLLFGVSGERAS